MTTMARLLGKYQPPAVLLDSSTLVSLGQHDIATMSSVTKLRHELLSAGLAEPYQVIVFGRAMMEYLRFFEEGVSGDYGIPKASYDMLEQLDDCFEFPQHLQVRIADARKLWKSTSSKSPQNRGKPGSGYEDGTNSFNPGALP